MRHIALIAALFAAIANPASSQDPLDCSAGCNGVTHLDSCLLGDWETNRNGPVEWLQRRGAPITPVESTTYKITFRTDGQYVIHPYLYDFTMSHSGHTLFGGAETTGGTGCWSGDGQEMHLCHADGGPIIWAEVRIRGALHTTSRAMFDEPKTTWNYNCGGSLRLEIPTDKAHDPIHAQMFRPGFAPPPLPRRMP